MNLQDNQNIHGVINGVHIGQHERVDELNQRIASRYFSDAPLEPNFAPRPVQTKQTIFPMVKNARSMKEKKVSYPDYNVQNNFNPGTDNGPPSGIINNRTHILNKVCYDQLILTNNERIIRFHFHLPKQFKQRMVINTAITASKQRKRAKQAIKK